MRTPRSIAVLTLVLGAVLVAPQADATTKTVSVANMRFSPSAVTVAMGGSVSWKFKDMVSHTTTSNQGFWDSSDKHAGQSYLRTFTDAGTFAYHCSIHSGMHGSVAVLMRGFGSSSKGYALRWSTRTSTPSSIHYDVQFKRAGTSTWVSLVTSTAKRTGSFNPSKNGTYSVRSRTKGSGGSSAWSPSLTLKIT